MTLKQPEETRNALLDAAFLEFYRNGFQGGSLNRIVSEVDVTKGALFYHFAGKRALGYAVVDERIVPLLFQRWLDPVASADDPVSAIQDAFRTFIAEDVASGHWVLGCPMNNLAQEMSPLDEGFRTRLDAAYRDWRNGFAEALRRGMDAGLVRPDVDADATAAFIVASQMGLWGTGKYSQDPALMTRASETLSLWLDTLRPSPSQEI